MSNASNLAAAVDTENRRDLVGLGRAELAAEMAKFGAEPFRARQLWQWIYHRARLADGREVTPGLFQSILDDEMEKVRQAIGPTTYDSGRFEDAVDLFKEMSLALEIEEFLTIPAYRLIA